MKPSELREHNRTCRRTAALLTDNIYELTRMRIVRVVREMDGIVPLAAEQLGCSEKTVRRYLGFVPFEHLVRDPALAERFDWRGMTRKRWVILLGRYPRFISRLSRREKSRLTAHDIVTILCRRPGLAGYFDLAEFNRSKLGEAWARLLIRRPEFAGQCDFSAVTARAALDLLVSRPHFFDRIAVETLLPYHWEKLCARQPQLLKRLSGRPHPEWPFHFRVYYLQLHPEFEAEFTEWDQIAPEDREDLKRRQPEIFARHFPAEIETERGK